MLMPAGQPIDNRSYNSSSNSMISEKDFRPKRTMPPSFSESRTMVKIAGASCRTREPKGAVVAVRAGAPT